MVALSAGAGYLLAGGEAGARLWWCLLGTSLAAAATGTLNQALEIEQDRRMTRTKDRPLPAGRLKPGEAVAFGVACAALGHALLAWGCGAGAFWLTLFTLASYLLVYTPMKRWSPLSTWVGAVPGATPPVIGWLAAGGGLGAEALALYALQFVWQLPHFLSLSWLLRKDYAAAGFRISSVVDPAGGSTAAQLGLGSALLLAATLAPWGAGLTRAAYLIGAAPLGAAALWLGLRAAARLTEANARAVFLASLAYLPAAYALLLAGRL